MNNIISLSGNLLLIICLATSMLQSLNLFTANSYTNNNVKLFSTIQFTSIVLAFLILIFLFTQSNFGFELVTFHSHSEKPFLYKISGAWGNHEGSLLLWILILTLFNFLYSLSAERDKLYKNKVIAIQSILILGFVLFSIALSNPFALNEIPQSEGLGLNPILQDPLLAIHPPILYFGYVGFSLVFSLAVAGLLTSNINNVWAETVKSWTFLAWTFLTAGIALGSYWAYYELGWGGYWFWDPVENASLMPWLAATALIHCVVVLQKKNTMQSWTVLLAIITFSLSLMGTFLVRSGVLNSVHTFASDPGRGLYILSFLFLVLITSFTIYALKSDGIDKENSYSIVSRDAGIMVNNWVLITILFIVFLGTIYPLFTDLVLNTSLTVGPSYYVMTITPVIIILLLFMIISPLVNWTAGKLSNVIVKMRYVLISSLTLVLILSLYFFLFSLTELTIIFLCIILILTSISSGIIYSRKNIIITPSLGRTLSHSGFGLLLLAIVSNAVYSEEKIFDAKVGDTLKLSDNTFRFEKINQFEKQNYNSIQAIFYLMDKNKKVEKFSPEIRFYNDPPTITSETSIVHRLFEDIYIVMNVTQATNSISVRIHVKPFMTFLWIGVILIILGGVLSVFIKNKKINA